MFDDMRIDQHIRAYIRKRQVHGGTDPRSDTALFPDMFDARRYHIDAIQIRVPLPSRRFEPPPLAAPHVEYRGVTALDVRSQTPDLRLEAPLLQGAGTARARCGRREIVSVLPIVPIIIALTGGGIVKNESALFACRQRENPGHGRIVKHFKVQIPRYASRATATQGAGPD